MAASRLLARSLTDRERLQGPRDPRTMAIRDRLAAACLAEGKIKDAVSHYKQVLGDRQKVLGRDHPDTLATGASLAAAYRAAGRMPAAIELSESVLRGFGAGTRARPSGHAGPHGEPGAAVPRGGRVEDAEVLLRRTAARCERVLPPGDPLTQAVQESLASIEEA